MRFYTLSILAFFLPGCGKLLATPPTLPDPTSDASVEDGGEPQFADGDIAPPVEAAPAIDAGPGLVAPLDGGEDARDADDGGDEGAAVDASDATAAPDAPATAPDAATPMEDGGAFTSFGPGFNEPYGITVGPDGNIWFTENGGGPGIARITTAGILTEISTPTPSSQPDAITSGSDGALWFTESGANQIGRCTTGADGGTPTITEFVVPTANAELEDIVSGPDGALWFTESGAGKIGRLAPDVDGGIVTEFSVGGIPTGIASGPDGALWFTQRQQVQPGIGRITTAGVVSEFPDFALMNPNRITTGSDGALWFTELNGDKIGRVTTGSDGGPPTITEFAVPSAVPVESLEGIASGPDGALWFAEYPQGIGRITTAGVYSELASPLANPGPIDLTFAPDGALWFTALGAQLVGRFAR